jgi:hypothetical protein
MPNKFGLKSAFLINIVIVGLLVIFYFIVTPSRQTTSELLKKLNINTQTCLNGPNEKFDDGQVFALCYRFPNTDHSEYNVIFVLDTSGQINRPKSNRSKAWIEAVTKVAKHGPMEDLLHNCFESRRIVDDIYHIVVQLSGNC